MASLSANLRDMADTNIWSDDWGEQGEDWSGGGGRSKRLPRAAERPGLGVTLYELGQITARRGPRRGQQRGSKGHIRPSWASLLDCRGSAASPHI